MPFTLTITAHLSNGDELIEKVSLPRGVGSAGGHRPHTEVTQGNLSATLVLYRQCAPEIACLPEVVGEERTLMQQELTRS
jgi:hypothetical protein